MLTFLFWNVQSKPLRQRVARVAATSGVDVVLLAECDTPDADVLEALNAETPGTHWSAPPAGSRRLKLFTRLPTEAVVDKFTEVADRMTIREIRPPGAAALLLAGVHLPSKFNWKDGDHVSWVHHLVDDLERIEGPEPGRLVLVGDLNMDPFDEAVVGGFGLHALATRADAVRRSGRVVQGRVCNRTFVNPMWRLLGERPGAPAGTYYRHASAPVNHYWHALDQVLLRPALADKLVHIEVLGHDGSETLLHPTGGWPDADRGSDHLPVLFRINP